MDNQEGKRQMAERPDVKERSDSFPLHPSLSPALPFSLIFSPFLSLSSSHLQPLSIPLSLSHCLYPSLSPYFPLLSLPFSHLPPPSFPRFTTSLSPSLPLLSPSLSPSLSLSLSLLPSSLSAFLPPSPSLFPPFHYLSLSLPPSSFSFSPFLPPSLPSLPPCSFLCEVYEVGLVFQGFPSGAPSCRHAPPQTHTHTHTHTDT